jgi:hypothetical protein
MTPPVSKEELQVPKTVDKPNMSESCVPYRRKSLYLLLTIPMIGMYVAIAAFLWQVSTVVLVVYCALFLVVAICQSYVCVYWQCPYVGKFAPCVGGFCLPSSQIARLLKNASRSERTYNLALGLASVGLLGIVVVPTYFLYRRSAVYLLAYLGIVLVYAASFLWLVCPACGTRHVCPGGQTSTKLRAMITKK